MFARIALALLLGVFTISIAACNTMEGAGDDVKEGGDWVEEQTDKATD